MSRVAAFTLVELLITLAIAALILGLASQLIHGTNRLSQLSVAQSTGIEHVQQAANVVADDVRRAYRIAASGQPVGVDAVAPGASATAGADQLVLTARAVKDGDCDRAGIYYEYVAYAFVTRSAVTGGGEWTSVAPDPANEARRVLVQYVACTNVGTVPTTPPVGGTLRIVSDYLDTGTFAYAGVGQRRVTLTLAAGQMVLGRATTGRTITTVAVSRNIY